MNWLYNRLKNFWTRDKSFNSLLIILVIYLFLFIPFQTENNLSKIFFLLCYYLLLTSSMPFLLRRNKKMIAYLLFVLPFILLLIEIYSQALWVQIFTDVIIITYCVLLAYIILLRTFQKGRLNVARVQGGIIVYLLAGLVFSLIFHSLNILETTKSFNGLQGTHRKEFLYFSLCTLSTDGYGDIVPLSPLARSISNLESLLGMLYPAVLLARLLSMEFYYKKAQSEES
jgi:hypothetical protein